MSTYTKEHLIHLQPKHDAFVGIDSDGCVFDTMGVKQKQCFHSEIIRFWGLEKVEMELRETAEFINLYSTWRGTNRFPALLMTFDMMRERPEVAKAGVALPDTAALRRYVDSGAALSNATLRAEAERTGDPGLQRVYAWSLAVNESIERTVTFVPPFRWAVEALELMARSADMIVVSQTPEEALVREWQLHKIDRFVPVIAGQELGTKGEHLVMASGGKYGKDRVLMIGDAPGDRKAARQAGALFYPVNPGAEEASWERLCREAFARFLEGAYAGAYEAARIREFDALLPETPPWTR